MKLIPRWKIREPRLELRWRAASRVLGRGSSGIFEPRFVRGFLGQRKLRVFKEQREASLGCRGRRWAAPARRHDAGEILARMAASCYVLQ